MTSATTRHASLLAERKRSRTRKRLGARKHLAVAAVVVTFGMTATIALAPPPPATAADILVAYITTHAQTFTASESVETTVQRDAFEATLGSADLAGATNYDWARLVLSLGGWPTSTSNTTVLVRWMRQENGPNNWWNRNNPLNNGWGSGGGGGTGTYPSLLVAAQNAAAALHGNRGYGSIIAALSASSSTSALEQAIWASPWSTSHYANGTHWSSAPVPEFKAPDGTW